MQALSRYATLIWIAIGKQEKQYSVYLHANLVVKKWHIFNIACPTFMAKHFPQEVEQTCI